MERRERMVWLDALRVLMCLFVVILHVASSGVVRRGEWMLGPEWQFSNMWDGIVRCCVPVFVMISGALFLSPGTDTSGKSMRRREARLALAYLFWSFLYAVWFMAVKYKGDPLSSDGLSVLVTKTLGGGYGHLWFLPMMFGLYLVLPFMKRIAEDEALTRRYLILWAVFWSGVPVLRMIPVAGDVISKLLDSLMVLMPLGYTGLFLLGHVLSEKELPVRTKRTVAFLGIAGLLVTVIGTSVLTEGAEKAVLTLYDYWMPNVILPGAMFFVLFRDMDGRIPVNGRAASFITGLSSLTFGIYLSHIFMIKLLWRIGFNIYSFTSILSIPSVSLSVFILSAGLTWVLKKIRIPM